MIYRSRGPRHPYRELREKGAFHAKDVRDYLTRNATVHERWDDVEVRCSVDKKKEMSEERFVLCVFTSRGVTQRLAADLVEVLAWDTRGSHGGVLGFDSDFEEPSKTPRTTFHGSPLDSDATHILIRIRSRVRTPVLLRRVRQIERSLDEHGSCNR